MRAPPKKENKKAKQIKKTYLQHKEYGKIPLVDVSYIGRDGKSYTTQTIDFNYRPTNIPVGAVLGNPNRQVLYSAFPKYYYEDIEKTCIQCGEDFIFSAKEQKHWYEDLQFIIYAECLRCISCRRAKRNKTTLNNQLDAAQQYYNQHPEEPYAMLGLAEAICAYYKAHQSGRINLAISLARKSRKKNPRLVESIYWEALALELSGNHEKAVPLFNTFIENGTGQKRCNALIKNAKTYI